MPFREFRMSRLEAGAATQGRLHWMDGARASLMLLGIPFHAAMVYSSQGWEISSPESSDLLTALAQASSAFRMPAFFLVAGFFAAMMLARRPRGAFLRSRIVRLGLPLVTCLLLLSPLQVGLLELASGTHGATGPLAQSFVDTDGHLRGDAARIWIAHLWFLIDLLAYTALLCAVMTPVNTARLQRLGGWLHALPLWAVAGLVLLHAGYSLLLGAYDNLAGRPLPGLPYGVISTGKWLFNLPFFVAGVLCFHERRLLQAAISWRRGSLLLGTVLLTLFALWPSDGEPWQKALRLCLWPLASWAGLHLVLGACARWLDQPSALVRHFVDSAYSIYLFHLVFIFAGGVALAQVRWPLLLEFVLLAGSALGGAWAVHLALRRSAVYRLLFNGEPPATAPKRALATATVKRAAE